MKCNQLEFFRPLSWAIVYLYLGLYLYLLDALPFRSCIINERCEHLSRVIDTATSTAYFPLKLFHGKLLDWKSNSRKKRWIDMDIWKYIWMIFKNWKNKQFLKIKYTRSLKRYEIYLLWKLLVKPIQYLDIKSTIKFLINLWQQSAVSVHFWIRNILDLWVKLVLW